MSITGMSDGVQGTSLKTQQPLGVRNYANFMGYVCLVVSSGIQLAGGFGPSNGTLSKKYQVLVSPANFAFSIWGVIFLWLGIGISVQMLPKYRHSELTVAITPWWLSTCLFQCVWSPVFSQEVIIPSVVLLISIWVSLLGLIVAADRASTADAMEFWAVRAGFSIHFGWVTAACAVAANVGLDYLKSSPETMLACAVYTLGVCLALTVLSVVLLPKPDAGVGLVIAWASFCIRTQLNYELQGKGFLNDPNRHNPYDWVKEDKVVVQGLAMVATLLCWSALFLAAVGGVLRWKRSIISMESPTSMTADLM